MPETGDNISVHGHRKKSQRRPCFARRHGTIPNELGPAGSRGRNRGRGVRLEISNHLQTLPAFRRKKKKTESHKGGKPRLLPFAQQRKYVKSLFVCLFTMLRLKFGKRSGTKQSSFDFSGLTAAQAFCRSAPASPATSFWSPS